MQGDFLKRWVPAKLITEETGMFCRWMYFGNKKFTEPFFDDTIRVCRQFPENKSLFKSTSVLEMLAPWSVSLQSIPPTAFIFHVSRCGSTLLSQLLSLDPRNIVLSEVPFLDEVLRLPFGQNGITVQQADHYFGEALQFYGQQKDTDESQVFVKLDSWHLFFYRRIRKLYPSVPFIILYRSPAEIIRSQQRSRGMQSVPGMLEKEIFGFTERELTTDLDLHMCRVLEKYFAEILGLIKTNENFLLFNYDEGIPSILERVLLHLGIHTEAGYREKINERITFDGKRPAFFFQAEEAAPNEASYLQKSIELYKQLEGERLSPKVVENKLQQQA
jgi:hypothetical protein